VPDFAFAEFKEMVAHLHEAGIEVILDVVYNHTAEGNELGPTLSFKGIDNASYYRLAPTGATTSTTPAPATPVNLSHSRVLQMVTDSLRYWARRCTSTASASTSPPSGQRAARLRGGRALPRRLPAGSVLSQVKLIAEPWDCGPGGIRSGASRPAGRSGTTATGTRCGRTGRATRGSAGAGLAITASADLFNKRGAVPGRR
jgi:glycogen operon protein